MRDEEFCVGKRLGQMLSFGWEFFPFDPFFQEHFFDFGKCPIRNALVFKIFQSGDLGLIMFDRPTHERSRENSYNSDRYEYFHKKKIALSHCVRQMPELRRSPNSDF